MRNHTRVLQVIGGLGRGGAERLLLNLISMLDRDRFEPRLISLTPHLEALDAYGFPDTEVVSLDLANRRWASLSAFAKYIDAFRPTIIHAHMYHGLIATVAVRCLTKSRPAICFTSHSAVHRREREIIMRALRSVRSADIIFDEGQHPGMNAKRIKVIGNGVPIYPLKERTITNAKKTMRFLFVGSLTEHKDPVGMLRAFLAANIENARLEYAGAGPLEENLRNEVLAAGLSSRVVLHGFVQDIRELMRQADCLVMYSKREGMPMTVLEAGAEAMPIVATPVGSIPNLLGQDRGILATPSAFPEALQRIESRQEEALAMGQRLREYIKGGYSIEATVRGHESLYDEISAEARLSQPRRC